MPDHIWSVVAQILGKYHVRDAVRIADYYFSFRFTSTMCTLSSLRKKVPDGRKLGRSWISFSMKRDIYSPVSFTHTFALV